MIKSICSRRGIAALMAAAVTFSSLPAPAVYAETTLSGAAGEVKLDPQLHYQTLEGWGTSLCWWGNVIGSAGDRDTNNNGRPDREEIAELAFSPDLLNLNIVRYNVGGGDKADSSIKRVEGLVPGWSKDMFGTNDDSGAFFGDAFYSKDAADMNDSGQIWMMEQANQWRKNEGDIVNEVFSNSPPYYMTKSGSSTGGYEWDKENLKPEYYDDFALYMARAAKWIDTNLTDKYGKGVQYVEPLNEPDTGYWINGSTKQEGCIFKPGDSQIKIYKEMQKALEAEGLNHIKMTGTDETDLDRAIYSFKHLDNETRNNLSVISAHTYSGSDEERDKLRRIAASYDKGLWMSEVTKGGGGHSAASHDSMEATNTRSQSEGIMADLKKMQSSAWIAWLVADSEYECMQTNSNWGLIHYVFEENGPVPGYHNNLLDGNHAKPGVPEAGYYAITKQFYTMMQYSKFLKVGYTMVDIGDDNMCAAISPDGKELVIVAQNFSGQRSTSVDLRTVPGASKVKLYRTSDQESCELIKEEDITDRKLTMTLPANSVSTYVISAEGGNKLLKTDGYKKIVGCDIETSADTFASGGSDNNKFTYTGEWGGKEDGSEKWSTDRGAAAAFKFTGNQAAIYGKKSADGADLLISVDGQEAVPVSTKADSTEWGKMIYTTETLEDGDHTLTITMAGEQTAGAPEIVVQYAEIITGSLLNGDEVGSVETLPDYVTVKGVVPNLPRTVKGTAADGTAVEKQVNWNVTSDQFSVPDYTTVTVYGIAEGFVGDVKAEVLVVPENLQYFVDCNNIDSPTYASLGQHLNLDNSIADQAYAEGEWGYTEEYGTDDSDDKDRLSTGWAAGSNQDIAYRIPLKKGSYELAFGFKDWWAQYTDSRPMKVTASYSDENGEDVTVSLANVTVGKNVPEKIAEAKFSLTQDALVTFTVKRTGDHDVLLSFFSIQQEIDHSELIAALGQARTIDRVSGSEALFAALDAAVADGHLWLTAKEAANEQSQQAAKAITDAIAALGTAEDFTEEELTANDYIVYLVNCGTPDASVIPDSYKLGLLQSRVDQEYGKDSKTNKRWGYASPDKNSKMQAGGTNPDDMSETYMYMASDVAFDKEKSGLKYAFTLPNRDYQVTIGFKNPWSGRSVDVRLEGETVQEDLSLEKGQLVEKQFVSRVSDGELNVMVHNPNRTSQYSDPVVNYIIVKAVPEYSLDMLKQALSEMDNEMSEKYWAETSLEKFQKEKDKAELLISSSSEDKDEIRKVYLALAKAYSALRERIHYSSFSGVDGAPYYDTNGVQIQAHGGQIQQLEVEGVTKYYWIGEDKTYDYRPVGGIHLYSSEDLYNWKDEGVVLRTMENMDEFETDPYFKELYGDYSDEKKEQIFIDLDKNRCVIERPKMLYNEKTDKYVIWFHADGRTPQFPEADYGKANAGIAIADKPQGPYKLLGSYDLNYVLGDDQGYDTDNLGSVRDMNLFMDDDKTAYVIYSSQGNRTTFISKLNDEYTGLAVDRDEAVEGRDFTTNFKGWSREAPAMFKYNDKYYIVNSGCTGWSPNPAQYAVADHPMGPWTAMGDPCEGTDAHTTFYTQSTCVFPVDAENGKFIYLGDRWNAEDLSESRYVMLPVEFLDGSRISLKRYSNWTLEELDNKGLAVIKSEIPVVFESLKDLKAALPESVDVSIGGNEISDAEVIWESIDTEKAYLGEYVAKGTLKEEKRTVIHTVNIINKNSLYFFDCATEASEYLEILKEKAPHLKNETSDQAYTDQNGAGFIGGEDVNFGKHEGNDLFSSGWWAKEDNAIEYAFELAPGEYTASTGYQEWWNTKRGMKVSALHKAQGEETELASEQFTLEGNEKALVQELKFTVPESEAQTNTIVIRIEKTQSSDAVLSFVGISSMEESQEMTYSVSGNVSSSYDDVESLDINLYEGEDVSIASPSDAVKTDEHGDFKFRNLKKGTYHVEFPAQNGYESRTQVVNIVDENVTGVDFVLEKDNEHKTELRIESLPAKKNYLIGEELDLTGLEVALYRDGAADRILEENEYLIGEWDSSIAGKKKVMISYTDEGGITYKISFGVTVYEDKTAPSIKILKKPYKQIYMLGEEIELDGMEVRGLNIMDEDVVILEQGDYQVDYDFSETGNATVTVTYIPEDSEELADSFEVTVYDPDESEISVEKIEITRKPNRLVYEVDEDLNVEGMKVERTVKTVASSSNAIRREEIPLNMLEIEAEDFSKSGTKQVKVFFYAEDEDGEEVILSDSFTVTVSKAQGVVLEGNLSAVYKKLTQDLENLNYLTAQEKQGALSQAIEGIKSCLDSYGDNGKISSKAFGILTDVEKIVLDAFDTISASVQAESRFGEVTADCLSLSADFGSLQPQKITLKLGTSQEEVPSNILEKVKAYVAMDITMYHNNEERQPELPVRIRMEIPDGLEKENLAIYHHHNGRVDTIVPIISGNRMSFLASEFSMFVVANKADSSKPTYDNSGDDSDEENGLAFTVPGTWKKDDTGWWYQKKEGGCIKSAWARINGLWYCFDERGYMRTDWVLDNHKWYYLSADGSMAASKWIQWKEQWYYLTRNGDMAVSSSTPDGYAVGADGVWIPQIKTAD